MLFKTIEEFRGRQNSYASENDLERIAKLVLPKDVLKIYTLKNDVEIIIDEKIEEEKVKVSENIDTILKEIIVIMDKVKDEVTNKITSYRKNIFDIREILFSKIENF